jgi:hypothetical protein
LHRYVISQTSSQELAASAGRIPPNSPEREVNPVILAAFLTDAHRERLTAALLSTPKVAAADLDLYDLVGP